MRSGGISCIVLLAWSTGCSNAVDATGTPEEVEPLGSSSADELEAIPASRLCVTAGTVSALDARTLKVDVGTMRGVVADDRSRSAELAFRYPGPSSVDAPLASGELRRQIGLKLRAQDSCNVVYVMWQIEPTPGIVVSVKHNAGASTADQCGDAGYLFPPRAEGAVPPAIRPDEAHTLRTDLDGVRLRVFADGVLAWAGEVPAVATTFDGPAGVRSDNGRFDFELRVAAGAAGRSRAATCTTGHVAAVD